MMDVNTAIFTRRSIRKFSPGRSISEDNIKTILKAGFHAPSAGNKRPVHFIVVDDRNLLQKLSEAKQEAEMINEASIAIVVCGDKEKQPYHDFLHEDCSASIENMLLC
ncbi:MAG: nitroreductase family protein, partial [Defluviitaleaceae bacterium]|nr:nitroreductase family protein [Defluviitaleaceae bacterium]